ncbi:MAG TPA: DUF4389 domain-containing protein [Acidimicrobiales bacterium]|nr:DUF4389 domain-containing protein [Acidimicrobiales bacterium]
MATTYSGVRPSPAPVLVAFAGPAPQRRVTVFFRLILALPALIVFVFVSFAAFFVAVIAWFGALVLGRLPTFAATFLTGYVRWGTRVTAYTALLTDKYPPFTLENDDAYPVWITAQPGPLNRWAVLFRIIIVLPAAVVSNIVQQGAFSIVAFVTWLIVLVNGTMPETLFQAYSTAVRYQSRVTGYFLMVTSEYPWGLFGDTETPFFGSPPPAHGAYGASGTGAYGAGAYGAPPAPGTYGAGAYGAPPAPGTYGAGGYAAPPPPTPGTFGASPPPGTAPGAFGAPPPPGTVGRYVTPPPPDPAATFATAPQTPPAPTPPFLPGVAFTFGGPSYLWGYTDDRTFCGIWSAHDLNTQPQIWPITEQGDGWTRFRELEPNAVALAEPTPPPTVSPWGQVTTSSYGAAPPSAAAGSSYAAGPSPADDPRWRIVLSSAAKRLIVLFLVLGLIVIIVNRNTFNGHFFQGVVANVRVQLAYQSLKNGVSTYDSSTSACQGTATSLSCITAADRTLAQDFSSFEQTVSSISVPAGAGTARSTLLADANLGRSIFGELADSTTIGQYEETFQSSHVSQLLTKLDQDEQTLTRQLS